MIRTLTLLPLLALGACGADAEPPPLTLDVVWTNDIRDAALLAVVEAPSATSRFFPMVTACARLGGLPAHVVDLRRNGAPVAFAVATGSCVTTEVGALAPGDVLEVTTTTDDGRRVATATVPELDPDSTHQALAAVATPDGAVWTATVHYGLVGLAPEGHVVRYPGVLSSLPYDALAREPQSPFITAIAPAAGRALWLGTATTGVSWFDPGDDPVATSDDVWLHGQPMPNATGLAADLAQTTLAIAPDPHDAAGLWIASPNGLHHARLTATGIDVVRVVDGPALSVAVDDDGRVWAGFSTQVQLAVPAEGVTGGGQTMLPMAPGALLVLDPAADPHDPSDDELTWLMEDEDAVIALTVRSGHIFIGTPYGLARASFAGPAPTVAAITTGLDLGSDLAVVDLAPARDGLWLAARSECEVDHGRLLHIELDADAAVVAVHDLSNRGFSEHDFASVHEMDDGRVIVSTFVPSLNAELIAAGTARGCAPPSAHERTADLWVLDPHGVATRFGVGARAHTSIQ